MFAILSLCVTDLFSVAGGGLLECVCCTCDPSERLDSICFVCVFVCQKLFPHLKSLRTGSQVLALLMLFLSVIFHSMSSGRNLQLLCILSFGMVVFVCHQYDVCEKYVGSAYIGGYDGLSANRLCVFRKLCPVSFLVVDECPSVCCSL